MKIAVTGNVNYYLETRNAVNKTIGISGTWSISRFNGRVNWFTDNIDLGSLRGDEFYQMCENIERAAYENISDIFSSFHINRPSNNPTIQELDLVKSLATTFLWYQYFLTEELLDQNEQELFFPRVYDEFIIDKSNSLGVQKDIYLLPQKYSQEQYTQSMLQLTKINLICTIEINYSNTHYKNYFIPFTKPGYKDSVFGNDDVKKLWSEILNDRNRTLKNFFNR